MAKKETGKALASVSPDPVAEAEEPLIENDMARRLFQTVRRIQRADEAVAETAEVLKGKKETAAGARVRLLELLEDARSGQRHLFPTTADEPEGDGAAAGSEPPAEPLPGHEEDPVTPMEAKALADLLRRESGRLPSGAAAVAEAAFVELGIRNLDELLAALEHEEPWLALNGMGPATLAMLAEAAIRMEAAR